MKISREIMHYIEGKAFSSSIKFRYRRDRDKKTCTRFGFIQERISGKRVIHLGCVDHTVKKAQEKRAQGMWMHDFINDHAGYCIGVDIAADAVEAIRSEMDVDNIIVGDITTDIEEISSSTWDCLLMPEILEHIDNPVSFLAAIREHYQDTIGSVIITVPNAFYYRNFKYAARHVEDINSDHRYWFTPYTLLKVLHQAGYEVRELRMCQDRRLRLFPIIPYFLRKRYPLLRSKIVVEAVFARG